jgi:hypothetical protein
MKNMQVEEDCFLLLKSLVLVCLSPVQGDQLYVKPFCLGSPFFLVVLVQRFEFLLIWYL